MTAAGPDLRGLPETTLVLAAQRGSRAAFTELVRRREGWLRALLRRLTGDAAEADDLAQEALLRAWRRLRGLKRPAAFAGWLRQLAVHLFIDARRLSRMALEAASEDVASEDVGPDHTVSVRIDLERAMQMLSPSERLCVTLNLGEGLSHREVAETTGLPLGTVKSHILRATTRLRKSLGESDE